MNVVSVFSAVRIRLSVMDGSGFRAGFGVFLPLRRRWGRMMSSWDDSMVLRRFSGRSAEFGWPGCG